MQFNTTIFLLGIARKMNLPMKIPAMTGRELKVFLALWKVALNNTK